MFRGPVFSYTLPSLPGVEAGCGGGRRALCRAQQQFSNTSVLRCHTDTVTCCKLIDEHTMVTASRDRTVRVTRFTPPAKGKPEKVRCRP